MKLKYKQWLFDNLKKLNDVQFTKIPKGFAYLSLYKLDHENCCFYPTYLREDEIFDQIIHALLVHVKFCEIEYLNQAIQPFR